MPNWKKVIVSGSDANLKSINVATNVVAQSFTGSLQGTASYASQALSSSYAVSSSYSEYAETASYATQFNVATALTASGLYYPTANGPDGSFLQTNAQGVLSFSYINASSQTVANPTLATIVRGTPLYVSGSTGSNPNVYPADASDSTKMPVIYIAGDDILAGQTGPGIMLGQIDGVNTLAYPVGTEIYVAPGGGWTATRPTGSAIVQVLGYVTKQATNGKGVVLNPGPANLPNLNSGSIWVGNNNSAPTAVLTSSLSVLSSSYASNADLFDGQNSSIFATTGSNIFKGLQTISGSLQVTGSLGVGTTASATIGRIDASNDVVAYATSDINLKENITPISDALYKITKVSGYEFDWKQDEELIQLHGFSGHDVGVIAQEIEEILPEVVTTRDSGYKAVKYEKIVPLLIQCIKELKQEIDSLKNK